MPILIERTDATTGVTTGAAAIHEINYRRGVFAHLVVGHYVSLMALAEGKRAVRIENVSLEGDALVALEESLGPPVEDALLLSPGYTDGTRYVPQAP